MAIGDGFVELSHTVSPPTNGDAGLLNPTLIKWLPVSCAAAVIEITNVSLVKSTNSTLIVEVDAK